ncbi:Photosystem II reaction center protein Z [Bienertia sinuspersici]
MIITFQLAVFALVATSSILLISVPVVVASPDGWSSNKNIVFSGTSLWIGLVFLVGILILSSLEPICSRSKNDPSPEFEFFRVVRHSNMKSI